VVILKHHSNATVTLLQLVHTLLSGVEGAGLMMAVGETIKCTYELT
jgi:hypothetical protein